MPLTNDDAENRRIYEESLHPDGMKKTEKFNSRTKSGFREVSELFNVNKVTKPSQQSKKVNLTKYEKMNRNFSTFILVFMLVMVFLTLIFAK